MNLIFLSCGLKLFFPGETGFHFTYCFPTKGKVVWFKWSKQFRFEMTQQISVFKVESRYQDEAMSTCPSTCTDPCWLLMNVGATDPRGILLCCFLLLCTRHARDFDSNRKERASPCKWEGLLPYVVAAHPSLKQNFKSVSVFTHPQHPQKFCVDGTQ